MRNDLRSTILAGLSQDEIISATETDITTFFDDGDLGKKIVNYHIAEPDEKWLKSLIHILPGAREYGIADQEEIVSLLNSIDAEMLVTLRGVYIVSRQDGRKGLCNAAGVGLDKHPDSINFRENDCLGCYWRSESAIVINLTALRICAKKLIEDVMYASQYEIEREGLLTTVAHEIRHLGLENNPFLQLDGEDDLDFLQTEFAVEEWGRDAYESWARGDVCPQP